MATHLKIVLLACLLSLMVFMEEVKPVLGRGRSGLRQRTKMLEESVSELKEKIKEQDEKMKEQDEIIKEQGEAIKECNGTYKHLRYTRRHIFFRGRVWKMLELMPSTLLFESNKNLKVLISKSSQCVTMSSRIPQPTAVKEQDRPGYFVKFRS